MLIEGQCVVTVLPNDWEKVGILSWPAEAVAGVAETFFCFLELTEEIRKPSACARWRKLCAEYQERPEGPGELRSGVPWPRMATLLFYLQETVHLVISTLTPLVTGWPLGDQTLVFNGTEYASIAVHRSLSQVVRGYTELTREVWYEPCMRPCSPPHSLTSLWGVVDSVGEATSLLAS